MNGRVREPDLLEFADVQEAERDPLNRLLATPADRTVLDNLPPDTSGEFLFAHLVALDGAGPVKALAGSTLERWGEVRRVLALAWGDRPRRELPQVCRMAAPLVDRERRGRVESLAARWPWEARS